MELFNKLLLPNHAISRYAGYLVMFMTGAAPTDAASLKAAIDIYDIEDIYNKCVGFATLRIPSTASGSADLSQAPERTALKGSPINYFIKYALTAVPNLQLGAAPDKIALHNGVDPYAKLDKLGMAGICRMHLMPWAGLDAMATDIPRCLGLTSDAVAVNAQCMVWEWNAAREFGGILRSGADTVLYNASHTLAVDAWVNGAWEQVLAPQTRPTSSAQIHHLFTKNVVTTKLRLRWSTTSGYTNGCHGCIPLEVKASTPAPVAVPNIEWAVLLPLDAYPNVIVAKIMERKDVPVPLLAAKVGGPGDGVGFDMIISKKTGLLSTDLPTVTGVKLNVVNAKE